MDMFFTYAFAIFLVTFISVTFAISRVPNDEIVDYYRVKDDPFWAIFIGMFLFGTIVFFIFPNDIDAIKKYSYTLDILLPFIFALMIYVAHLFDMNRLSHIIGFVLGLIISFTRPNDFNLYPEELTLLQSRIIVACLIYIFSFGLSLLNGLSAIASMQIVAIMVTAVLVTYLGGLPQNLGFLACVYLGSVMAFLVFSWPPEKLILHNYAFMALGFVMSCFMTNASVECADSPMLIAGAYIVTEFLAVLYKYFVCFKKKEFMYMSSMYYDLSKDGKYEAAVVFGILKILVVNIVLALIQIFTYQRNSLFFFTLILNWWLVSVLSGKASFNSSLSITSYGINMAKKAFSKKKQQ